jgi:hypothetical protein
MMLCISVECGTRFTHANRHCPDHPNQALVRDEANMPTPTFDSKTTSPQAVAWLQRFAVCINNKKPSKLCSLFGRVDLSSFRDSPSHLRQEYFGIN